VTDVDVSVLRQLMHLNYKMATHSEQGGVLRFYALNQRF